MCHPEVPEGHTAPGVERIEVEVPLIGHLEKMPALLCRPQTGAGAGVLLVADVFGRSPFYEDLAGRLALAGAPCSSSLRRLISVQFRLEAVEVGVAAIQRQ